MTCFIIYAKSLTVLYAFTLVKLFVFTYKMLQCRNAFVYKKIKTRTWEVKSCQDRFSFFSPKDFLIFICFLLLFYGRFICDDNTSMILLCWLLHIICVLPWRKLFKRNKMIWQREWNDKKCLKRICFKIEKRKKNQTEFYLLLFLFIKMFMFSSVV